MRKCPVCARDMLNYHCEPCGKTFDEATLIAVQISVRFDAFAVSKSVIRIRPGTGDGPIIQTLFDKKDRKFLDDRGVWIISDALKYKYVPCVKAALSALGKQEVMFGG